MARLLTRTCPHPHLTRVTPSSRVPAPFVTKPSNALLFLLTTCGEYMTALLCFRLTLTCSIVRVEPCTPKATRSAATWADALVGELVTVASALIMPQVPRRRPVPVKAVQLYPSPVDATQSPARRRLQPNLLRASPATPLTARSAVSDEMGRSEEKDVPSSAPRREVVAAVILHPPQSPPQAP